MELWKKTKKIDITKHHMKYVVDHFAGNEGPDSI